MAVTITRPGKAPRSVKNLGWLLRNWKHVEGFNVSERTDGAKCGALLVANLRDGGTYSIPFNSAQVLWDFLHRPVFYSLPLAWGGQLVTITKGEPMPPLPWAGY